MIRKLLVIEGKLDFGWTGDYWKVDDTKIEDILTELKNKNVKITIEEIPA